MHGQRSNTITLLVMRLLGLEVSVFPTFIDWWHASHLRSGVLLRLCMAGLQILPPYCKRLRYLRS